MIYNASVVPLPPYRSQLLPRGPRLLLSLGCCSTRLLRIGLGPLGAGLKPRPGLFSRRDLLVRRPARPVQLHLSRLSPGHLGLRAGYRVVPLPPYRSQLLPRGPRLLLSGGLGLPRPGQPRLSLGCCSTRLLRIGLGPLGAGLKPRPGLFSRRDLLVRRPARPVQLHLSRLSPGHPGLRAAYRVVPLPPYRSQLLPRGPRLLLSLGCCSTRLLRIGLGPLGAGLKPRPGLFQPPRSARPPPGAPGPARPEPTQPPPAPPAHRPRPARCGPEAPPGPLRPPRSARPPPGAPGPAPPQPTQPRPPGTPRPGTASSRSRRTAASCSRAARASCSAAACASRAPASRASASAAAARASRASSLGPLAAPPERGPRRSRVPRTG